MNDNFSGPPVIDEAWQFVRALVNVLDAQLQAERERNKALEAVVNGLRKSVERRGYCPLCARTVYHDDGVWQHNEDCALGALDSQEREQP